MQRRIRVYGDFNNMDPQARVRLNVRGSRDGLQEALATGLPVVVYDEDLCADAVLEWSEEEAIWVARLEAGTVETGQ